MRSTLDYEELEDEEQERETRDFTLGVPALLGIFFVIAVACAVFFGWGYSSKSGMHLPGLHAAPGAPEPEASAPVTKPSQQQPVLSTESAPDTASDGSSVTVPDPTLTAKPAPGTAASRDAEAQVAAASEDLPTAKHATPVVADVPLAKPRAAIPAPVAQAPVRVASVTPAEAPVATRVSQPRAIALPATATAGGAVMIQVAAVARPADAQAMVAKLRGQGFSAVARTLPTDHFEHVQVGPLTSKDAARIMRGRLIAAGYPNAYIRP